jgi:hypothetical protein
MDESGTRSLLRRVRAPSSDGKVPFNSVRATMSNPVYKEECRVSIVVQSVEYLSQAHKRYLLRLDSSPISVGMVPFISALYSVKNSASQEMAQSVSQT